MQSINRLMATLILGALSFVDAMFISRIKNQFVQRAMRLSLDPIKNTINALSDGDPKNDEQVKAVWDKFSSGVLPDFAESELGAAIEKVQDKDVKALLVALAPKSIALLHIVTDNNPNNGEQVKVLGKEILNDEQIRSVIIEHGIIPAIRNSKLEEGVKEYLILWLTSLLDGGLIGIEG